MNEKTPLQYRKSKKQKLTGSHSFHCTPKQQGKHIEKYMGYVGMVEHICDKLPVEFVLHYQAEVKRDTLALGATAVTRNMKILTIKAIVLHCSICRQTVFIIRFHMFKIKYFILQGQQESHCAVRRFPSQALFSIGTCSSCSRSIWTAAFLPQPLRRIVNF